MKQRRPMLSAGASTRILFGVAFLCFGLAAVAQPAPGPVVTRPLPAAEAGTVLGRGVLDSAGDNVGPLVDVLVDKAGKPLAGVIDVGGFLGVGIRRVAVAWRLLHFNLGAGDTRVVMDLTFDSAAAAPEFLGSDNMLIVIDRPSP